LLSSGREIATLIGAGSTNKQIARQLAITERTVKAHLTGIFRKLGIGDRLKLALRVTGQLVPERESVHGPRGETYPSDAPASSLTPS
jgi:DNA-binding CsgD family transcriptional regulator